MANKVATKIKRSQKKFSKPAKAGSSRREHPAQSCRPAAKGRRKQPVGLVLHRAAALSAAKPAKAGSGRPSSNKAPKNARPAIKRTNSLPGKRAIKAAGLPPPAAIKRGSAAYKALERKWYAKLAADGFQDLEWSGGEAGTTDAQNSDYLRGSGSRGRTWAPERAQFYRLLQNYLTHHSFRNLQDRYVMHALNDGKTYRQILAVCKQRYKLTRSLYWFYYYVQDLVAAMVAWNGTHAEGLLNPANQDQWADDALLADLRGTAGVIEAPNGLKLDQGWWIENLSDWWRNSGEH